MVRSDTSSDGDFELLGFGKTFSGKISRVEAMELTSATGQLKTPHLFEYGRRLITIKGKIGLRRCNDNFGVSQFLVEFGILALLVGRGNQCVPLVFEPFPDTQLVLGRPQKLWDVSGVLVSLRITLKTIPYIN